jgi:hypothetical protein
MDEIERERQKEAHLRSYPERRVEYLERIK